VKIFNPVNGMIERRYVFLQSFRFSLSLIALQVWTGILIFGFIGFLCDNRIADEASTTVFSDTKKTKIKLYCYDFEPRLKQERRV